MTPTRWGLLGAGWISRRAIAPAMHSAHGATLDVVAARDQLRAASLSPRRAAVNDYASVVEDPDVDAVYIALSNDGHLPWAERALGAGKAVLCEKPLGRNADEARRMREVAASTGGLLVEATWNLWHPRTARAAALLASDAIGAVTGVHGAFVFDGVDEGNYRLDPARGGGALLDVGCYPLTGAAWAVHAQAVQVESVEMVTGGWASISRRPLPPAGRRTSPDPRELHRNGLRKPRRRGRAWPHRVHRQRCLHVVAAPERAASPGP